MRPMSKEYIIPIMYCKRCMYSILALEEKSAKFGLVLPR